MILNLPITKIIDEYKSGLSIKEISNIYNCSTSTIINYLKKNNIEIESRRRSDFLKEMVSLPISEIINRYLEGETASELAVSYNCDVGTIINRLRKSNIEIRPAKEYTTLYLPINDIIEKYESGFTIKKIAKIYNCSSFTIHNRLCINNIEIRTYTTEETKQQQSSAKKGCSLTNRHRHRISAGLQKIPYDEWEEFAYNQPYCPDFNEECKESNREKYGRCCFLTGLPESENITSTGKHQKLSVHHVDMDKMQGCDGKRWKLVPLCLKWHSKIHTKMWEARIIWLLNNVWNTNDGDMIN